MIYVLCAKSSSGKDALFDYIKENYDINPSISLTTRPIREGEINGITYKYLNNKEFEKEIENGNIIEYRKYNVNFEGKKDIWYYGTSSISMNLKKNNLVILDLDGLQALIDIFGKENIYSFYIEVKDDIREERAKKRGSFDQVEWNRRLKDDNIKFNKDSINICNHIISNNNFIEDFIKKVDNILKNKIIKL
jgi:guanylate kinase